MKISKVHIVGFSLGSQVASRLAADSPQRINSLVLVAAESKLPQRWRIGSSLARILGQDRTIRMFASRFFYPPTEEKLQQLLKGIQNTRISVTQIGKTLGSFSVPMELAIAPYPILLVYGEMDPDTEQKEGFTRVSSALKLVIVKDSGHKIQIDRPAELSQIISDFCSKKSVTTPTLTA